MNLYLLVEGRRTEPAVYRGWLRHRLPWLQEVGSIDQVTANNLLLLSGYGYPSILDHIAAAAADIRRYRCISHFVVSLDSDDHDPMALRDEVQAAVGVDAIGAELVVIVQVCCIETWLLGNRRMVAANPQSADLRRALQHYDVRKRDPEQMEAPDATQTRSQYHLQYLRSVFQARGTVYSKQKPGQAASGSYYDRLVERLHDTGHIGSFGTLDDLLTRLQDDGS
ncbi:MAG: hypothetical protein IT204_25410 [Fimbriimonadaceae bacterium]|nr:hypothetical protein [Fimbriimonadaceae bacterium]